MRDAKIGIGTFGFLVMAAVSVSAADDRLVRQPMPAATPTQHVRIPIFGRDYWTWMHDYKYADPLVWDGHPSNNAALRDLPVFRECALDVNGLAEDPLPEGKSMHRKVASYFTPEQWDRLRRHPKPGRPLLLRSVKQRGFDSLAGEADYDRDDFTAFKASQPDFWGFETCDEWDVGFLALIPTVSRQADSPRKREILAKFGREQPKSRREFLSLAKRFFDSKKAVYYDTKDLIALRSCLHIDHHAAAWGAKHLMFESTDTTGIGDHGYRWDVSAMFVRGAARQFHVPWSWYSAIYKNGVRSTDGTQIDNSTCYMPPYEAREFPDASPRGGVSASLEERCWYFAFVNGAASVEPEEYYKHFFDAGPDGKSEAVLTRRGQAFSDFHDFASSHPDRGDAYCPVALLIPFDEAPSQWGQPWGWILPFDRRSISVDAAFCTLIPGTPRAKELQKFGHETALRNSPYAQMYDVLTPDSPQKSEDFLKALSAYPAAVLLGQYEIRPGYSKALVDYVRNGGTLFVNSVQVPGEFDADFLGLSLGGITSCGSRALGPDGKTAFHLSDNYEIMTATLKTAKPLLVDEKGQVLAAVNDVGKGRVVTTTPTCLMPPYVNPVAAATGETKFPFYDWIFSRLQEELFPVKVTGSCLYGLTRTSTGWWLWVFNNRGVGKFADKYETVDHAYDTVVRIDASKLGKFRVGELVGRKLPVVNDGRFAWPVKAGEFAIFKIKVQEDGK